MFFYNGPIHWICMSGSPSVAEIILREFHHIKIHQLNAQNKTGLYYLIGKKTKNVIRILNILLQNGLDINFKPENGNSILTDFVLDLSPDLKVIEFLLQNGADSRIITTRNISLYEIIEDSVKNQIFYVQSQRKAKIQIFELFQKYKII